MFWPDILREFADRLEADPANAEMNVDHYSLDNYGTTERIAIELVLPIISNKEENE